MSLAVPAGLDELTATGSRRRWPRAAGSPGPRRCAACEVTRIGQDTGFLGHLARLSLDYVDDDVDDGAGAATPAPEPSPRTLVAKLPPATRAGGRWAGCSNVWQRESRFFAELAARCGAAVPGCWYNGADPAADRWALLLEDRGGGPRPTRSAGPTRRQAEAAVTRAGPASRPASGASRPRPPGCRASAGPGSRRCRRR